MISISIYLYLYIFNRDDSIGELYLSPYGIHDRSYRTYFSYNFSTVESIKFRNPSLINQTFITVRNGEKNKRPFLIVNAAILGPTFVSPRKEVTPVPAQFTSLYMGAPVAHTNIYQSQLPYSTPHTRTIGGGFVEPHVFGGSAPIGIVQHGPIKFPTPLRVFTLTDVVGAASNLVTMRYSSYPLIENEESSEESWMWSDGGFTDNLAIISLLLRKVEIIVAFVNTDVSKE